MVLVRARGAGDASGCWDGFEDMEEAVAGVGFEVETASARGDGAGDVVGEVCEGSTNNADSKMCCWFVPALDPSTGLIASCELSAILAIFYPPWLSQAYVQLFRGLLFAMRRGSSKRCMCRVEES